MCLGSPLEGQHRGAAKNSREYYRGGWSPSPLPNVPVSLKGVPGWCGLCWGLTMGTPTPKGAGVEAVLPRMARVSQERCQRLVYFASVGLSMKGWCTSSLAPSKQRTWACIVRCEQAKYCGIYGNGNSTK